MLHSFDSRDDFVIIDNIEGRPRHSIEASLHSISLLWRVATILIAVAGCTPTVYKPEVEKFSKDVGSASASFDQLVVANVTQDFKDRNTELVAANTRLDLSESCRATKTHVFEQNECLAL
jgi:hypothetical protein